jgi:hypothetical protein
VDIYAIAQAASFHRYCAGEKQIRTAPRLPPVVFEVSDDARAGKRHKRNANVETGIVRRDPRRFVSREI